MKLVHASISENRDSGRNGQAKAGDSTGKEVCIRTWYAKPWDVMLRYHDRAIGKKAASAAIKLANSNLVGYDQTERNTLYKALKKCNFDIDEYIKSGFKTECDCSSFVYAVYCCFIPDLRSDDNSPTTSVMLNKYRYNGFSLHTDSSYLLGKNLLNGDILLKIGSHVAIATDGNVYNTNPVNIIDLPKCDDNVSKAIDIIAKDVIKGNWGSGTHRRDKIYVAIQNRVNEILRK